MNSFEIGARVGPYEVLGPLGAGGMGQVYRALDTRLGREVAIKALPEGFSKDAERLTRFDREARLLASVNHPNIATIFGLEDAGGTPCLVLELVPGQNLAQRLGRGPMLLPELLAMAAQVVSAVEAAHARGIVHRDLKPGNIMLTPEAVVKVLDFGLAKAAPLGSSSTANLTATPTVTLAATGVGQVLGTAPYMSPEQVRGREVDARGDIWAIGCILYECLSGRQAFDGETVSDVIARILEREPDLGALPGTLPAQVRDVIARCLAKDIAGRYQSAGELKSALAAAGAAPASGISSTVSAAPAVMPSLAVLYFENLDQNPESEYFCAGITEDILTDLSKIKGLRVASRNAVSRFRGKELDIAKVAEELGVTSVLEGSVRRAGERVRISAQLIHAKDGFHIWAERYDRTLQDVFAVQEEIASSIAAALKLALAPEQVKDLLQDRPKDVRAYDLYLKGREHYNRFVPEEIQKAKELFEQALEVDADYALAWAGLADCAGQLLQWDAVEDRTETIREGLAAADRALGVQPKLAEAWKARALVMRFAGDLDGSRLALLRALEFNPRYVPALINLCVAAFTVGNVASAERFVRRGLDVDPQHAFSLAWLGTLMSLTGRHRALLAHFDQVGNADGSDLFYTVRSLHRVQSLIALGDVPGAISEARMVQSLPVRENLKRTVEALALVAEGKLTDAKRLFLELSTSRFIGTGLIVPVAEGLVQAGELDVAVQLLQSRITMDLAPMMVRGIPGLRPLTSHPAFAPARSAMTLIWPIQAPMMDPAILPYFKDVKIESGIPQGSGISEEVGWIEGRG